MDPTTTRQTGRPPSPARPEATAKAGDAWTMRRLFSVSMPRAGHHVAEMVLGRLLGSRFAYCEFYTIRTCCHRIPCTRMDTFAAGGALAFMQKSHDHDLADPVQGTFDGVLVQVREPVARALSNYELDLATVGPPHSTAYMRFWLGLEAAYTTGFIDKWCAAPDPRALILRYEDLLADPVSYYRSIFERFRLPMEMFDEAKVSAAQSVSSGDKKPFRERDIRSSAHYDADNLSDFQRLVARRAAALGYQPHEQLTRGGGKSRAIAGAFEARQRLLRGDRDGAMEALDAYLALPDAHVFGRRLRATLLAARGDIPAAQAELRAVMAGEPTHPRAYLDLAEIHHRRDEEHAAKATLDLCLENARDPGRASALILETFSDPALTATARTLAPRPEVTREEVVAAFRFILGREPEGEAVIESHQRVGSATELREILLRSPEFAEKYRKIAGQAPA